MDRFRLKALKKANIEALMVATGQNVKRLDAWDGRYRGPWHKRRRPYDSPNHRSVLEIISEGPIETYLDME